MRTRTYAEAIAEGLVQGMARDPDVFIMGIGVDDHKGIFGTTRPAYEKFGADFLVRGGAYDVMEGEARERGHGQASRRRARAQ